MTTAINFEILTVTVEIQRDITFSREFILIAGVIAHYFSANRKCEANTFFIKTDIPPKKGAIRHAKYDMERDIHWIVCRERLQSEYGRSRGNMWWSPSDLDVVEMWHGFAGLLLSVGQGHSTLGTMEPR